jgi:hypothetical protein
MPSSWIENAVSYIRGEDDVLYKQVPPAIGNAHITELLGRHPFHPFDPDMSADHPCAAQNRAFFQCMSGRNADEPLHMKHVNCYHPFKTDLMKCNATQIRLAKKRAAEAGQTLTVQQMTSEPTSTTVRTKSA